MPTPKLVKKLGIAAIVVVVLIIVAMVGLVSNLDKIVERAIEESLAYVLLVDVELGSAEVSLKEGSITLRDLTIGNPDGFKSDEAFSFSMAKVRVDAASIRTDTPTIELVSIREPTITIEQTLKKSNLQQLIRNASRFSEGEKGGQEAPPGKEAAEKGNAQIKIGKVRVEKSRVQFASPLLKSPVGVTLPTIELNDLGTTTVGKAMTAFFEEALKQSLVAGRNVLPDDLAAALTEGMGEITQKLGSAADKVGDGLKSAAEGVTGQLQGLFGKKDE